MDSQNNDLIQNKNDKEDIISKISKDYDTSMMRRWAKLFLEDKRRQREKEMKPEPKIKEPVEKQEEVVDKRLEEIKKIAAQKKLEREKYREYFANARKSFMEYKKNKNSGNNAPTEISEQLKRDYSENDTDIIRRIKWSQRLRNFNTERKNTEAKKDTKWFNTPSNKYVAEVTYKDWKVFKDKYESKTNLCTEESKTESGSLRDNCSSSSEQSTQVTDQEESVKEDLEEEEISIVETSSLADSNITSASFSDLTSFEEQNDLEAEYAKPKEITKIVSASEDSNTLLEQDEETSKIETNSAIDEYSITSLNSVMTEKEIDSTTSEESTTVQEQDESTDKDTEFEKVSKVETNSSVVEFLSSVMTEETSEESIILQETAEKFVKISSLNVIMAAKQINSSTSEESNTVGKQKYKETLKDDINNLEDDYCSTAFNSIMSPKQMDSMTSEDSNITLEQNQSEDNYSIRSSKTINEQKALMKKDCKTKDFAKINTFSIRPLKSIRSTNLMKPAFTNWTGAVSSDKIMNILQQRDLKKDVSKDKDVSKSQINNQGDNCSIKPLKSMKPTNWTYAATFEKSKYVSQRQKLRNFDSKPIDAPKISIGYPIDNPLKSSNLTDVSTSGKSKNEPQELKKNEAKPTDISKIGSCQISNNQKVKTLKLVESGIKDFKPNEVSVAGISNLTSKTCNNDSSKSTKERKNITDDQIKNMSNTTNIKFDRAKFTAAWKKLIRESASAIVQANVLTDQFANLIENERK